MLKLKSSLHLEKICLLFSALLVCTYASDSCSIPAICDCVLNRTVSNTSVQSGVSPTANFAISVDEKMNICDLSLTPNRTNTTQKVELSCSYINIDKAKEPLPAVKNGSFLLNLTYPCIHPPPDSNSQGYSTGTILVIIFFTLLFAYLAFGVAVNYFILGARGIELIPNLKFWRDLPGLIKDGATFIQNGCKVPQTELNPRSPDSYDAI